jgi:hypothetical protein
MNCELCHKPNSGAFSSKTHAQEPDQGEDGSLIGEDYALGIEGERKFSV